MENNVKVEYTCSRKGAGIIPEVFLKNPVLTERSY
jgi:hypothetical protein